MNKLIALLLLLCSATAAGQTSVEEVQDRLTESAIHSNSLLNQYSKIERDCDMSWMDSVASSNWLYIRLYAEKVHWQALELADLLDDPNADLAGVRRALSSPDDWELNNPRTLPLSIMKRARTLSVMIVQANSGADKENGDCGYKYGALQLPLSNAWMYLDEALWHLDDAIALQ